MPGLPRRPLTPVQKAQARGQIKNAFKATTRLPAAIVRKAFTNANVTDVFPGMKRKKR